MTYGSTVRPPPRRRSARRIAAALCIALFVLPFLPGRVEAYPCAYVGGEPIVSADCAPPKRKPARHVPGEANAVSLLIFVGALVGVLLIPVSYFKTGAGAPE
jgi:hypothetical protein